MIAEEPTVRLSNGREVLQCVFDSLRDLRAKGHRIVVIDHEVIIDPPISADWTDILNAQPEAVRDVLAQWRDAN